jgi:very-short-patch-repair endonuclease
MGRKKPQPWSGAAWERARQQHGVVTRAQLLELGLGTEAISHRLRNGRLHPLMRGVYIAGRPAVDRRGRWMGAVLACGPDALLSHRSAAALWRMHESRAGAIDVSVPDRVVRRRPGIRVHRRARLDAKRCRVEDGIPVTDPVSTLIDLALCVTREELEAAINEADHRNLVKAERLREALDSFPGQPGVGRVRRLLDSPTFAVTQTRLEQRFLPIAHMAGLPLPRTQVWLNGYRVDFHWPELGLVVETDGLRYHRTPAKQAADQRRDQAHVAAGLVTLRFTHWQVFYEPAHVRAVLATTARRAENRHR